MNQIVIEHTVWTVFRTFLVALPTVVALLARVAFASTRAHTFWAGSTILWTFFRAPEAMMVTITCLALTVFVGHLVLLCRILRAVISDAC